MIRLEIRDEGSPGVGHLMVNEFVRQSARSSSRRGSRRRPILFLACAMIALPLLAAHAPPRLKLVGIFPVAIGVAAGCLLLLVQSRIWLSNRVVRWLAAVIVPLVLCGFVLESFRGWRADYREMFTAHLESLPGGGEILTKLRGGDRTGSSAEMEMLAVYRDHMNPDVDRYLAERRTLAVPLMDGPWKLPRNAVIWIILGELVLGSLAGIAVVFWNTREPKNRTERVP